MTTAQNNRVLFISSELIAADLAHELVKEGCDVKLYIENEADRECFDGMVHKTGDWRSDLEWVGKEGLIVFDDVGYGKFQDELRSQGYSVVGGSGDGDRLEMEREYGQEIMASCGIQVPADFETKPLSVEDALNYVEERRGSWVIKQDDHNTALTYVSEFEDGSDAISVLRRYRELYGSHYKIALQKRVHGIEIAVGRFFNGNDWVGPIVLNREHKHFSNDDIGPLGGETGTLMWYDDNEENRLFQETLAKLKPHLQKSSYRGYVDINCIIVDEHTLYPLEITSRFGSSTNQMQSEMHTSPWSEFLGAVGRGESYNLEFKKGYGINVALTVPPFPYKIPGDGIGQKGVGIFFRESFSPDDAGHIHFEEVALRPDNGRDAYFVAANSGYVLYVTGVADTIEEVRERVYKIIKKIHIPRMFYRTDIGLRFMREDRQRLAEWGWV